MGPTLANQSHSAPSAVSVGCSTVTGGHNNEAVVVSAGNSTTALPSSPQSSLSQQQPLQNLANTKEKTSMCLINELARFNKVNIHFF